MIHPDSFSEVVINDKPSQWHQKHYRVKSKRSPDHHSDRWIFSKPLTQSWKHTTALNVRVWYSITVSLHWNKEAQTCFSMTMPLYTKQALWRHDCSGSTQVSRTEPWSQGVGVREWAQICTDMLQHPVESFPKRLKNIITGKKGLDLEWANIKPYRLRVYIYSPLVQTVRLPRISFPSFI